MFIYKNQNNFNKILKICPGCPRSRASSRLWKSENGFFCAGLPFKRYTFPDLLIHEKKKKKKNPTQLFFSQTYQCYMFYIKPIFSCYKFIIVLSGSLSSIKCICTKNPASLGTKPAASLHLTVNKSRQGGFPNHWGKTENILNLHPKHNSQVSL